MPVRQPGMFGGVGLGHRHRPDCPIQVDGPGFESITSESVFQAARAGDRLALRILEDVIDALSVGLTNGLHMFNPDLVVLGGGVTVGLTELNFLPRIQELMLQGAMSEGHKDFRLVASRLGDGAGMAGAAAMVWEAVGGV